MINTVIFDLGKVLVEFDPVRGMEKLGFSKEAIVVFKDKIFPVFWESCDEKQINDEDIRRLFKEQVPGFEKEVDILWDSLTKVTAVYDYSHKWIKEVKARGLKVYILSNYGQRAFEINSQIYPFLDDVDGKVISYEVEIVKPDERIYDIIAKKYDIKPQEAVFIDDRQANIDAALKYGFKGILFESYKQANGELLDMLGECK